MNIRLKVLWVVLWVMQVRTRCWYLLILLIVRAMEIWLRVSLALTKKRYQHRVAGLKTAVADWGAKTDCFRAECLAITQAGGWPDGDSKRRAMARQSALQSE